MTDSSPKQTTSLFEAIALAEASAFRITPTYLYAFKYKDGNKSLGLVPVHIKHPNVSKHIFDLVDPEPGTPLANTVIGTIPKHYKAATDLVLKDATKTLKDVLTKDGASDDAEPLHPPKSAAAPTTKADVQAALGGTASVPLDAYLHAVQFNKDPATDLKLLKNPQVTATLLKVYGANWKEKAAALGFAVPGVVTVKPEVANAAKILNFSTGSDEFKVLAALHEFGNLIDATAEVNGEDASDEVFDKNYLTFEKVIALAKKAGLATANEDDDGIVTVKFKPMAASPMLVPAPPPPVTSVPPPPVTSAPASVAPLSVAAIPLPTPPATSPAPPGFVTFNLADLNNGQEGVTIQNPKGFTFEKIGGKWWLDGIHAADTSALVGQAFRVVTIVKGPKTPGFELDAVRAAPPALTTTTPTTTQTAPVTLGGLGLPAIPPLTTLSLVGDAKASLGGAHPKQFVKDAAGNTFLFKPGSGAPSHAAAAYSQIASKVFGAEGAVPVVVGTVSGVGSGSVQPMIPNIKTDLSKVDLTTLTLNQLARLMKERVLDWALASHDAKAANFMLTNDGNVVGIDKDQALKFIGKDSLDTTYKPNPSPLIYGALFDLFKKKKVELPVGAMLPAIEAIEAMSDDGWLATLSPYFAASGMTPTQIDTSKKAILARKKNVRKDLEAFITGLFQERGDIGMTDTFEFEPKKKKKKKKDLGGMSVPPMGSILSPAQLPALGTLTPLGDAQSLGGAGEKYFFGGPDQKYLVKMARSKDKSKNEPKRVAVQEIFSQMSAVVRPGKSVPVAEVAGGYKGIPATIQPFVDLGNPPNLKSTTPTSLTTSEKKDVAEEHTLDWLLSQHDTHGANLIRRADGTILSIDKEQGFKFFMPGSTYSKAGDSLSTDFHPNTVENPPFYNKFWGAFADGSMDFDPTTMKGAIERIEGISDSNYTELLSKYVEKSDFGKDPQLVGAFIERALARKKNIRKDFESFISGLYKKRTKKKKGEFSFAGGWSDGASAAPLVAAPAVPPASAGDPQKLTFDRSGGQALLPSASDPLAQKVLEAVGASLFSANSPSPIDPSLWSEVADSKSQAAVTAALASIENITKKSLDAHLKTSAVASFPNSPLLQQAALQQAFNQKNMLKVNAEAQLTSLMEAKTGKKGKYTFAGGWTPDGALPPPITHTSTESASAIASAAGLEVLPSTDDPTKVVLKIAGQDWKTKQADFEAKAGVTSSGTIKEKPSKSVDVKVFVPYDKATFEKAGITKTWVEQPPAPSSALAPSPKKPTVFPTHAPALPYETTFNDLNNVQSAKIGSAGKTYPTDGDAVENNSLLVNRVVGKDGKTKFVVSFKLRPEHWGPLMNAGTPGNYAWPQGSFDPTVDAIKQTGLSSDSSNYEPFSLPVRVVSKGADRLHLSTTGSVSPDGKLSSGQDWGHMGQVQAEIELEPGQTLPEKLTALLDQMKPGLGAQVIRPPTAEDAEITKLARVVWSQLPEKAQKLKPSDFTVAGLKKILAAGKVPDAFLAAQESEVFPGYKSYVVPGRWKSPAMTLPDGSPKVRFMLTSSATPMNIIKNLSGKGPGPASQTQRLHLGIGLGKGASMTADRQSGGSEQSMWRLVTQSKGHGTLESSIIKGNTSNPYRYLIPPDELDRLDTVHYLGDSYGNLGGNGSGKSYWNDRKPLEEAVSSEQDSPLGSTEVDFRKGVAANRVLRVLCSTEAERKAGIAEAAKQGVTHLNGIPVEDFFVATGNRSMEDIYQQFVKPMGY
jgi:hypothetical protein